MFIHRERKTETETKNKTKLKKLKIDFSGHHTNYPIMILNSNEIMMMKPDQQQQRKCEK